MSGSGGGPDRAAFSGARALVVGLGTSGEAAARVLAQLGAHVVAVDSRADVAARAAEALPGVTVLDADGDETALAERALATSPRLVVAGPGLAPSSPLLAVPRDAGLEIWSEVELAWRVRADDAPWLTLTGTNGKTTTVEMLSSILTADGRLAPAVGNVGTPISAVALYGAPDAHGVVRPPDAYAVELSSFQLHHTFTVEPTASACLNISPDHLDWHGTFDAYRADKARVYARTRAACVYSTWDPATRAMVEEADVAEGARAIGARLGVPGLGEVGLVEDVIVDRAFHAARHIEGVALAEADDLAHLARPGIGVPVHVLQNALVAAALARAAGVTPSAVATGLRAYAPGAHRIEAVAVLDGVTYVDDSKATNAHAASASLAALEPGRGVWIAGGLAKGATFDELVAARSDRLRGVVLIGVDATPWADALRRHAPEVPVIAVVPGETEDVMSAAVARARALARPGDTVLLAPAGASHDQFASYAARGDAFAAAVRALEGGRAGEVVP
ncbi:UDP-N-acetylmuramoylalanine/D-glutamate ligase [Beutenbergia cavernae DSM 12333]|uniref:UDP-N-acetylmuramoylalanine--D-glutamate ligase n=1 Tax=Beutenbergia cavernae (strain ATCC BAA-8 / DSM 12333 / CCUG 43141 / JCM 11478 / NBRC 16432 / NCIMB 13614 / HKI 0122) TaxID=471853 RepID=C5BW61_BEUC1|nr:UDP-N-acetylmuramoyl-L-alanine--D-glutamate ligase [Beutenbergia cavernae]ACQ80662.1 UDP-N-acetylmuramoylalanine/D-glutamate ligase [Beutenbergia cavernae DSM 12333]